MRYSLANYKVELSNIHPSCKFNSLSLGGEGSYLDNISINMTNKSWDTISDKLGNYVHVKNLDKTGSLKISLNIVSESTNKFIQLCKVYDNNFNVKGLTIKVYDTFTNTVVVSCEDCYLTQIPDVTFSAEPEKLQWTFTCGKITFES